MIQLTERLLNDAGGWQAMKAARAMHEAGRVVEATWDEPWLRGRVREGETEYSAGLKIASRTDIENLCTCRASRRDGMICAHSLAIGIEHLRPRPRAIAPVAAPPVPVASETEVVAERGIRFSTEEGMAVEIAMIVPPQLEPALARGNVTVSFEAIVSDRRSPLASLAAKTTYRCSPADFRLLRHVLGQTSGQLPAALSLFTENLVRLLPMLAGHPRITLGRGADVAVQTEPRRLRLAATASEGCDLRLRVEFPEGTRLLASAEAAWLFEPPASFAPIAPELPAAYRAIFRGDITIPAAGVAGFLDREAPVLGRFFDLELPGFSSVAPPPEVAPPTFTLKIEGSLNHLAAELESHFADRAFTPTSRGYQPRHPAETAALQRLRKFGFDGPDARGEWVLKGEPRILQFFARDLPSLERDWKVTIGARFEHVTRDLERIEPRLDIRSSGENWFEMNLEFAAAGGERVSATEIRRLLRSGQNSLQLRNKKRVVLHAGMLDEFEQVLLDCNPEQRQPGVYRFDRRDAPYVDSLTQTVGARISGEVAAVKWCPDANAARQPQPIPLGHLEDVLRDYQKQGVSWLNFLSSNGVGGILSDEMGLGKTLQSLAYLSTIVGRSLVVCPSSLVINWLREADRFTPELGAVAVHGSDRTRHFNESGDSRLWITSYALLRRDLDFYRTQEFATVVLDEAQHIKNPDSQAAQAVFALRATRRFALTGTPIENSVRDIWSVMNFLMPDYLGTCRDFRERFEGPIANQPGGPEHQRLIRRLRPFLLRRTKREVAKELPEKIQQIVFCELNEPQKAMYGSLLKGAHELLADLSSSKSAPASRMAAFTMLLRLRQTCLDLRLLGLDEAGPGEASAKMDLLSELLTEAIADGHRVLVFSQFSSMLQLIQARLSDEGVECCYLDGSTRDRQAEVDRFQTGAVPVFLISLKAGGVGLNLTAADTVIHFDPWWNPAVEAQATDRAHRIGQARVVTAYKLIARGTVEEKILALQARKQQVMDLTVESEQPLMNGLTVDDIRDLLEA